MNQQEKVIEAQLRSVLATLAVVSAQIEGAHGQVAENARYLLGRASDHVNEVADCYCEGLFGEEEGS